MTTPHGHPDFQGFANSAAPSLYPTAVVVFPVGSTKTAVIPCANWGSLYLNIKPSAGTAQVFIRHWQDAAGTITAGNDEWPVNPNTGVSVRSPLRANYVQVDITVTSAGAMTAITYASLQSSFASELTFPVGFQGASDLGKTLLASTGQNYYPNFIAAGRAWIYFSPNDVSGKLQLTLYETNEAGAAFGIVTKLVTTTPPITQALEVPDTALILQVLNNDGAAPHTYDVSLTIPPQ